ncbi:unnamed protein product, partial [Brugia timori]|uniref:Uncharacterized protein n=1 Tax=Brugia timori TaxID=42155 RepID=A0A0R3QFE2_9BILA
MDYREWVKTLPPAAPQSIPRPPGIPLNPSTYASQLNRGKRRPPTSILKSHASRSGPHRIRSKSRRFETSSSDSDVDVTPKRKRVCRALLSPISNARRVLFTEANPIIIPNPPAYTNATVNSSINNSTPNLTQSTPSTSATETRGRDNSNTPDSTPSIIPSTPTPTQPNAHALFNNVDTTQLILNLFQQTLNHSATLQSVDQIEANEAENEKEEVSHNSPPPPPPTSIPTDAALPIAVPPLPKLWDSITTDSHINVSTLKPPKFQLPKFSGDKLYYRPFIENFRLYVHERNDLSLPQKIQYLEDSLSEQILLHIKHYPATIEGYKAKLKHLDEKYGNENEIREELWRKFTALQPKSRKVPDIQICFDQALLYINLLKLYYGTDVKLDHLRTVFCQKFPPAFYESRLNPTDESLDHLIWCIQQTLKVKNISYEAHKSTASP